MDIISILIGLVVGLVISYIIFNLLNKTKNVSKADFDALSLKHNETVTNLRLFESKAQTLQETNDILSNKLTSKESEVTQLLSKVTSLETNLSNNESKLSELLKELTTERETNKSQQNDINLYKQNLSELSANNKSLTVGLAKQNETNEKQTKQIEELTSKLTNLTSEISKLTANNSALTEKLETQKTEVEELQKTAHLQFEKIANKLFEEKSKNFTETNKINIETLLNPLKEDINKFKEKVEATHTEDTKQRTSLDERIKGLIEQTNKVSAEANNLATALKGKAQKRGNWGEMILERILESSGLTKDREYFIQQSIKDDEGKNQRLDVKVNLPDDRVIIIDSKVSLIAYDKFSSSEDGDEQKTFLTEHINATKLHIDQLSSKRYDNIEASLDFTMMFIPIEPAYLLAIQGDSDLWSYAYSKRILLVSPTTLIACLKLFSDLWRREWQNKNAMNIVKRGELLYEKFVGFTVNFEEIGNKLNTTQKAYDNALGQLKTGRGNVISQAIQLKNLGLKSNKKVPDKLIPLSFDDSDDDTTDDSEG
ncbi:DNA recombination protein RmuC [Tenacibaculum sp. TC6]|uniref:DNA recombination protein RmuC n=1 Tax=Tenacibaculum sp. TC6 TaxID=3423223 RepID=UPI003D36B0A7